MTSTDSPATRLATRLAFLVAGFGVACWAPLVPFAKQRLAVDDGTLGLLLLCLGIGSVTAMLRTGPLCARYGCKPVIVAGGALMTLLLPGLALAGQPWQLAIVLFAFGGALGSLDVAMNVHAVDVERGADRPLMSGFHGMFSVGGFAGSALMTFLLSLSMGPLAATLVCAAPMALAMVLATPRLLTSVHAPEGATLALPRGPVLLLAGLAAVTFLVEGALLDWSALLLTDTGLAAPAQAGLGYSLFSVTMTAGRLTGDVVVARIGDRATVGWGGSLAVAGFLVVLLGGSFVAAMAGFALIGLGASNVVPVLFRRAGAQKAMPAALAVSAVTTTGYAGYLMGPGVLGTVSRHFGLPAVFWILAALMLLVPLSARRVAAQA